MCETSFTRRIICRFSKQKGMKCMVCGKPLTDYALIGKKNDMEVAFCTKHIPDCAACDSCDLRCARCYMKLKVKKMSGLAKGPAKEKRHHNM